MCPRASSEPLVPRGFRPQAAPSPRASPAAVLGSGVTKFNVKPSKGIQYLVKAGALADDPGSVAAFLAPDGWAPHATPFPDRSRPDPVYPQGWAAGQAPRAQ